MEKLRCQRIGCDATFTSDDNPDGSCIYHDAVSISEFFYSSILLYIIIINIIIIFIT